MAFQSLARLGADTLGIDASSSNIAIASLHASNDPALSFTSGSLPQRLSSVNHKGKGKLTYEHTSVEDLLAREGPSSFDVVCSMEVVEHVDNPRAFLSSCAQLLKVRELHFPKDISHILTIVYSLADICSSQR